MQLCIHFGSSVISDVRYYYLAGVRGGWVEGGGDILCLLPLFTPFQSFCFIIMSSFWSFDDLVFFISSMQVGSQPITSVAWLPTLRVLVTLSKDGTLQMWKTRVILNPNRPPTQANFFEPAG